MGGKFECLQAKKSDEMCAFSLTNRLLFVRKNVDITYTTSLVVIMPAEQLRRARRVERGGQISFCNFTCRIFMASRVELFVVNEALVSS